MQIRSHPRNSNAKRRDLKTELREKFFVEERELWTGYRQSTRKMLTQEQRKPPIDDFLNAVNFLLIFLIVLLILNHFIRYTNSEKRFLDYLLRATVK